MGVPERLWMGGMSHRMYQSTGLGQMNSARLKLGGDSTDCSEEFEANRSRPLVIPCCREPSPFQELLWSLLGV